MKKFTLSLITAVILHIIVLVLSGFLIGDKQATFFEYQSIIPLQFGSGTNPQSKNAIAPRIRNKIEVNPSSNNSSTDIVSQTAQQTEGVTLGSDFGFGSGTSFESVIVNYQAPSYPRLAQVRGLQGNVRIRIKVTTDGVASETTILKSSGHDVLDKAATDVVSHWRFQKKEDAYYVEKNIVFQLKN